MRNVKSDSKLNILVICVIVSLVNGVFVTPNIERLICISLLRSYSQAVILCAISFFIIALSVVISQSIISNFFTSLVVFKISTVPKLSA